MSPSGKSFSVLVQEILRRFCGQNALPPPGDAELHACGERLWGLVEERGLAPRLTAGDQGSPGEMSEADCAPLVDRVLGDASEMQRAALAVPLRQLVKACFHPEFKVCRNSFREISPDGTCRRQQLKRVRGRVSGAHCVDCPYWIALTPQQHRGFLTREWQPEGREEFETHRDIFLPEDFRALRRVLYSHARRRI